MTLIGMSKEDKRNDIEVLNRDLFFENRGVWAYGFAATKLSKSEVGQAVLALGLENRADHQKHQEMLINAINDLGGTPIEMEKGPQDRRAGGCPPITIPATAPFYGRLPPSIHFLNSWT